MLGGIPLVHGVENGIGLVDGEHRTFRQNSQPGVGDDRGNLDYTVGLGIEAGHFQVYPDQVVRILRHRTFLPFHHWGCLALYQRLICSIVVPRVSVPHEYLHNPVCYRARRRHAGTVVACQATAGLCRGASHTGAGCLCRTHLAGGPSQGRRLHRQQDPPRHDRTGLRCLAAARLDAGRRAGMARSGLARRRFRWNYNRRGLHAERHGHHGGPGTALRPLSYLRDRTALWLQSYDAARVCG